VGRGGRARHLRDEDRGPPTSDRDLEEILVGDIVTDHERLEVGLAVDQQAERVALVHPGGSQLHHRLAGHHLEPGGRLRPGLEDGLDPRQDLLHLLGWCQPVVHGERGGLALDEPAGLVVDERAHARLEVVEHTADRGVVDQVADGAVGLEQFGAVTAGDRDPQPVEAAVEVGRGTAGHQRDRGPGVQRV
jgi:hypothetical protein